MQVTPGRGEQGDALRAIRVARRRRFVGQLDVMEILERVTRESPGPLEPTAVRRVFERIIDESRRLERLAASEPEAGG